LRVEEPRPLLPERPGEVALARALDQRGPSDRASLQELAHRAVDRIEALIFGDHQCDSSAAGGVDHAVGCGECVGKWLLTQDVLAGRRCVECHWGVEVVGKANIHRVDVWIGERQAVVGGGTRGRAQSGGERRSALGVHVDGPADIDAGFRTGTGVAGSGPATADDRDL